MKKVFAPTLILAGLMAAGPAVADTPYSSWSAQRSTEVAIDDSFNRSVSSSVSEDNDIALDFQKSISEDNDVTVTKSKTEDNDYTSISKHSEDNDYTSDYRHSEDNDITKDLRFRSDYRHSEDNDYTSDYRHSEDNDVHQDNDITKSWQQSTDVDFQIATPTLTGYKYQDQDAGHTGSQSVLGAARGHTVAVEGGPTSVSAGNDEQVFFGPAMVNNNVNMLPQTDILVNGANYAPISAVNTMAGRDMGDKGVFAPVGNTSAVVSGDTLQRSSAGMSQTGDSANSIADQMNASIAK
jgi:hypothetical protein